MFNRFEISDDPLDNKLRFNAKKYLLSIRKQFFNNCPEKTLKSKIIGKRVLDIGICEHSIDRINSNSWKHKMILSNASYVLGIDIDEKLVNYLKAKKYNVTCIDATSGEYLGEKFDVVNIGDVIEHVSNPLKLLEFAKRHLNQHGQIIVRTPNPFHFNYYYLTYIHGISVENMEHLSYIVPFHMLEICRRLNMNFDHYYEQYPLIYSKYFSDVKLGFKRIIGNLLKFQFRYIYNEFFGKPSTYSNMFMYVIKL